MGSVVSNHLWPVVFGSLNGSLCGVTRKGLLDVKGKGKVWVDSPSVSAFRHTPYFTKNQPVVGLLAECVARRAILPT